MDVFFTALETVLDAKRPQAQEARADAQRAQPQAQSPKAQPKPRSEAFPSPHPGPHEQLAAGGLLPLFEDGKSLIRAIVAAEVLGPPVALREPSPWSQRPNEPSI